MFVKKKSDPFYLITLREVKNISEVYDLEITYAMTVKMFGKKNCSSEELEKLIEFQYN